MKGVSEMKKLVLVTVLATFILGSGTAFAADNGEKVGIDNFGQMKSHMQEMHPDLSVKELKEKFDSCHESMME